MAPAEVAADTPLLDLPALRRKLARLDDSPGAAGRLWRFLRQSAAEAPELHPWFVPFVAAVTGEETLLAEGRRIIERYLAAAEVGGLGKGVQFHFWCFAFPHARWALWFDLLRRAGAYDEETAAEAVARFVRLQQRDFHAGLLTKPHPECVDNQAASLCLSDLVIGTLFGAGWGCDRLCTGLRAEALQRAEAMIGGMPRSGYSGEGSTYQGRVVAVTIPFLVEFLERATGQESFRRPLPPNGTSAEDILRMTVRLWMPSGLLLPWDDYGYQFGTKGPVAYLARRSGDAGVAQMLARSANWSDNNAAGWGFDDPVWALVFWPEEALDATGQTPASWAPWAEERTGGAIVDPAGRRYLLQMWDPTSTLPLRPHVNPNALVLEADGVPLTADGKLDKQNPTPDFAFEDTWIRRRGVGFATQSSNYGKSTAAGHSVLIVDGWESLRPRTAEHPQRLAAFEPEVPAVAGDVTGLYESAVGGVRRVRRRSRLVAGRFWLVEDLALFEEPREVVSRWYFRPGLRACPGGADLETPEGMRLHMRALLGPGEGAVRRIDRYPADPDDGSDRIDYPACGAELRWLWLFYPQASREALAAGPLNWRAWPGPPEAAPEAVLQAGEDETYALAPAGLPWFLAAVPLGPSWWYTAEIPVPADRPWWLRLPRGLPAEARLWIDGEAVDLSDCQPRAGLLPVDVPAPADCRGAAAVRATLHLPFAVGHFPPGRAKTATAPDGPVRVLGAVEEPLGLAAAEYRDGTVRLRTAAGESFEIPYALMPAEEDAR